MLSGESKCIFLTINKIKIIESHETIVMNWVLTIKPFKEEDSHNYHGQDENVGYVGPLNKTRVTANYKNVYERSGQANYLHRINWLYMLLDYQS